jgi:hypothetical protein
MIRLQRHGRAEEFFGEPLQQQAGEQTVEVAFVGDDDFRLGQRRVRNWANDADGKSFDRHGLRAGREKCSAAYSAIVSF